MAERVDFPAVQSAHVTSTDLIGPVQVREEYMNQSQVVGTALTVGSNRVRRDGELWCITDLWRAAPPQRTAGGMGGPDVGGAL